MNWIETRRRLLQLASRRSERGVLEPPLPGGDGGEGARSLFFPPGLGPPPALRRAADPADGGPPASNGSPAGELALPSDGELAAAAPGACAASLCMASGKGGTGKTVVTASLAALFGRRGRTLVVDADLGVGNAHILQDVSPQLTLVDVVEGDRPVGEVVVRCSESVDLVGAGSGVPRMADLSAYELHLIAAGLASLEESYRFVLVDSAAGVSRQTLGFAAACDLTLLVTTPDLTAMTDAYAFLKVLVARTRRVPLLLVNRARDEAQAAEVVERIQRVSRRFLDTCPIPVGWIPEDPEVGECVNRRGPVVELAPETAASRALRQRAVAVLEALGREPSGGLGRRLLAEVGFARGLQGG